MPPTVPSSCPAPAGSNRGGLTHTTEPPEKPGRFTRGIITVIHSKKVGTLHHVLRKDYDPSKSLRRFSLSLETANSIFIAYTVAVTVFCPVR